VEVKGAGMNTDMNRLKEFAMRKLMRVLFGSATLVMFAGLSAQAQTSVTSYQVHYPISQTLTDVCMTGSPTITLSGEYFFEYFFQQQANGDTHLHWTSHYNITGVEDGIQYIGTDQQKYDLKADPDGFPPQPTSDFHTTDKFKLIAQGPYPKETIQSFLHVKVNAGNVVTVNQEKAPIVKCQGK
jgi:hypothetical protein